MCLCYATRCFSVPCIDNGVMETFRFLVVHTADCRRMKRAITERMAFVGSHFFNSAEVVILAVITSHSGFIFTWTYQPRCCQHNRIEQMMQSEKIASSLVSEPRISTYLLLFLFTLAGTNWVRAPIDTALNNEARVRCVSFHNCIKWTTSSPLCSLCVVWSCVVCRRWGTPFMPLFRSFLLSLTISGSTECVHYSILFDDCVWVCVCRSCCAACGLWMLVCVPTCNI